MKIIIDQPQNQDCNVFYMDRKVAKDGNRSFDTEWDADKVKAFAAYPWLEEIHNLNGVHYVSLHDYQLMVFKGRVFDFATIVPQIEAILQREFPENLA